MSTNNGTAPATKELGTVLTGAVDELLKQLRHHEEGAAAIRAQLRAIQKQIKGGGPRAGAQARSGRKRRQRGLPLADDTITPAAEPAPEP